MATALTAAGVQFPDASVLGTNPLPSGTRLLFHNSTAPTGWTKDTSINDSALRVVSGTPGSGGSSGFASALGSPSVSGSVGLSGDPGTGNLSTSISGNVNIGNTTLSTSQMPSHTHVTEYTQNGPQIYGGSVREYGGIDYTEYGSYFNSFQQNADNVVSRSDAMNSTGSSGSHNHNASHNLSGAISGVPSRGTLSASLSSASASINVKYQDFILAQKD